MGSVYWMKGTDLCTHRQRTSIIVALSKHSNAWNEGAAR